MTAAPIAPSRRSSHAWRRSIALISREAGKVYVTCVLRLRPRPTRPCLPTPRLSLRSVIIAPSARAASRRAEPGRAAARRDRAGARRRSPPGGARLPRPPRRRVHDPEGRARRARARERRRRRAHAGGPPRPRVPPRQARTRRPGALRPVSRARRSAPGNFSPAVSGILPIFDMNPAANCEHRMRRDERRSKRLTTAGERPTSSVAQPSEWTMTSAHAGRG